MFGDALAWDHKPHMPNRAQHDDRHHQALDAIEPGMANGLRLLRKRAKPDAASRKAANHFSHSIAQR